MNLPEIRETEILPQDDIKFCFWNHTFYGKQFQKMMHNSFPELLTKTPTKYISTEVIKQQYKHIFLYFILIYIVKTT